MRQGSANTIAAITNAREKGIKPRTYVWFIAKNMETGAPENFGFHNDIDTFDVTTINGKTNTPVINTYYGDGSIKAISQVTYGLGLTVRRATMELSNVNLAVNTMVRGFDIRNAQVQIYFGILDPDTNQLVDNPRPIFIGKVTRAELTRPRVGGEGGIAIDCVGFTDELTRVNPARVSDSYMTMRSNDRFLRYIDIMGDVKVQWGNATEAEPPKRKKFLGIF